MKTLILLVGLLAQGLAFAQSSQRSNSPMDYDYLEFRFVDVDLAGGDGFKLGGSYELENNWLLVGSLTSLDFNNNVDSTIFEIGAGYVWNYSSDFDFVGSVQFVRADFDSPGGGADDNGIALAAGFRGFLAPQFEVRGSVNHVNLDDSDTFLELAGDYYFTDQFSGGISLEFAGDVDIFTIGGRWFFN